VTTHLNPEADALGSQLALFILLKKLRKSVWLVNQEPFPQQYSFLPYYEKIIPLSSLKRKDLNFDCMVVLDCSDLTRTAEVYKLNKDKPIINIDHHISNEGFGSFNWVEPSCSSTAEMVYLLYKKIGLPFDRQSAVCLYAGIMSDTGSFRYSNSTSFTHQVVSELLRFQLNPHAIYRAIYENIPFQEAQFLLKILNQIHKSKDGKICWLEIPARLLRARKFSFDLTEYLLSFMRAIKDTRVCALFKENLGAKKEIRFNLRSNGEVDVNKVARLFGGGGHKTACGGTVSGKLQRVRLRVLKFLRKMLG